MSQFSFETKCGSHTHITLNTQHSRSNLHATKNQIKITQKITVKTPKHVVRNALHVL
eukprot:m.270935 g.270935  ORF g.270935 m.270935 type:complete len:57 (+) comp92557_c0_seq1:129-299(+)